MTMGDAPSGCDAGVPAVRHQVQGGLKPSKAGACALPASPPMQGGVFPKSVICLQVLSSWIDFGPLAVICLM